MKKIIIAVILAFTFNMLPADDNIWGRIANEGFENEPVKSAYFFAGNWKNGVKFYEFDAVPNTSLYTIYPLDPTHLGWSESEANREFAVNSLILTGFNVINMSYWGPEGTDNWAYWAPMQTSSLSHDELFDIAVDKNILITPYIESYAATDSSPGFSFMDDFPGSAINPAPGLVAHIEYLIDRYLINPENEAWPAKWAQMFDQDGKKRYVISLIHVASNQEEMSDQIFAEGFDNVAEKVHDDTGILVGFTIDALPRSESNAPGLFKPSAAATGPWLFTRSSILAVSCFIPEIWTGKSDEDFLLQWKMQFSAGWINTGIPFIQDVSPGYDAHIVFPGSVIYGNNNEWREGQSMIVDELNSEAITFNTWNGYTEGFAGMPTAEYGDTTYYWICGLLGGICDDTVTGINKPVKNGEPFLFQVFPNPFGSDVSVHYHLNAASHICLKVYDSRGSEAGVIEDLFRPAGTYITHWNPRGLPDGMYFIRLDTEKQYYVMKVLLLNNKLTAY